MKPINQKLQFTGISDKIYRVEISKNLWQFVVDELWNEVDIKVDRLVDAVWEGIKCSQPI